MCWFMDIHIEHTLPFVCIYLHVYVLSYVCMSTFTIHISQACIYKQNNNSAKQWHISMDFQKYDQNDMTIKGSIKDRETVYMHMDMIRAGSLIQ